MNDKPNFQVRKQLDRKLPGELLTLDEIRELKKIEAERGNACIKRGVTKDDESQVWKLLFEQGRFLPANRRLHRKDQ